MIGGELLTGGAHGMLTRDMMPPASETTLPDVVPAQRPVVSRLVGYSVPLTASGPAGPAYVGQDPMDPSTWVRDMAPMAGSAAPFSRLHQDTAKAAASPGKKVTAKKPPAKKAKGRPRRDRKTAAGHQVAKRTAAARGKR
jgi:hypothetical protein